MKPTKLFAIIFGILWVLFLDSLVFTIYPFASIYFLVSALIHIVLSKLAIGIYVYHLILIDKADVNKTVLETQENLQN